MLLSILVTIIAISLILEISIVVLLASRDVLNSLISNIN